MKHTQRVSPHTLDVALIFVQQFSLKCFSSSPSIFLSSPTETNCTICFLTKEEMKSNDNPNSYNNYLMVI